MKNKLFIVPALTAGLILFILAIIFHPEIHDSLNKFIKPGKTRPKQEPNDWMAMQRIFPYGRIKPEVYLSATRQVNELIKNSSRRDNPWSFAGPDNIGGRITDIECPPGNPGTIYVGAATGGIMKTEDSGATWENLFGNVPVISIGDIAIDPDSPEIIYAGTGEANASSFSFLGNGIYKSTDAGQTWQHMGLENSAYIGRVIVDYSLSQRIFVAACGNLFSASDERGVYRSLNGGQTWERVLFINDSTSAIDLVQHPTNPQILYAAMWERCRGLTYRRSFGQSSGIWKSSNGGTTWTELTNGLPKGNYVGRIGLSIAKSNPDILYAFYDLANEEVAVYQTINGGQAWTRTNDWALYGMNSNFGWYFGQIRVDPADPNHVFVMGVPLFSTSNGGNTWTDNWDTHVDHHAMFFDETTGRILEGNDGGLYFSDNNGSSWEKINNLPLTQFYAIDVDNQLPQRIYGGTQDNNTIRTLSGATSDWAPFLGGDGMYTLVDYTDSDILYAESQWGYLNRSFDGGNTMEYIGDKMANDRVNWSAPLAMHPEDPYILYFGTYRIWKSTDYGSSWEAISGDLTHGYNDYFYTLTTIAISAVNPAIILTGSGDGKVYVSDDNGQTWRDISAGLPDRWITHVAADPFDMQTIYVTLSGFRWDEPLPHVFKSTNLGQSWTDISSNLPEFPVNDIALDPDLPGRIIVGTDAGLYGTTDGGQTWSWIWNSLPAVPICALKVHVPSRTIVAGTYGLSAYKASLDEIMTGIVHPEKKGSLHITAFPNPVSPNSCIRFYLPENDLISIKLYGLNGALPIIIFESSVPKGEKSITFSSGNDLHNLSAGVYLLTVEGSKFKGAVKIIKN